MALNVSTFAFSALRESIAVGSVKTAIMASSAFHPCLSSAKKARTLSNPRLSDRPRKLSFLLASSPATSGAGTAGPERSRGTLRAASPRSFIAALCFWASSTTSCASASSLGTGNRPCFAWKANSACRVK
eukprot:scaffold748_cov251-Pinguiococcus_pyrenoidosus.AAC.46